MSTPPSPFQDHASPILSAEPSITDADRASLWDVFHQSKDANELANKLQPLAVPDDLKHKLWTAKQTIAPPVKAAPIDKVTAAVNQMAALPPDVMEKAETHPNLLKAFTTAATTPEPEPPAAAGATSAEGKGKTTPEAEKTPLAPRGDGQAHFPPIPDGHKRVLHPNGGVYDVPEENLANAQASEPNLHILNP
jgi:hypothetical protein